MQSMFQYEKHWAANVEKNSYLIKFTALMDKALLVISWEPNGPIDSLRAAWYQSRSSAHPAPLRDQVYSSSSSSLLIVVSCTFLKTVRFI